MKIKSLWISNYKNIKDTKLYFKSNVITLLVGQNGLGKSNLIEAIALIFRSLDTLLSQEDFELWPILDDNFEYEIEYECKKLEVSISCKDKGGFEVKKRKMGSKARFQSVSFYDFNSSRQSFLPDYIIGYYSGGNKRLQQILKVYEDQIIKDLKSNEGLDKSFRKMFFAQDIHGPLVLVTLLMYSERGNNKEFGAAVKKLIDEFVSFSAINEFGIQFKSPSWYKTNSAIHQQQGIDALEDNIQNEREFSFWGAKGKADKAFKFFFNSNDAYPKYYRGDKLFGTPTEVLELDQIDILTAAADIEARFPEPIDFFDAFETLLLIDSLSSIHLKISSKNHDVIQGFAQLSEGEQQLICVLGLILIAGHKDCLFLLDEPDTHLNPKWQRDYVRLLEEFNLNDDNSHIIVATHSPLIVQSAEKADIMLYRRCENGSVEIVNNDKLKIHNWRVDQVLASEYFEFDSTRPPSLDGYMALREKILAEGEISNELEQKLNELENEFGVLPTGETIDEIRALLLVKSLANKL